MDLDDKHLCCEPDGVVDGDVLLFAARQSALFDQIIQNGLIRIVAWVVFEREGKCKVEVAVFWHILLCQVAFPDIRMAAIIIWIVCLFHRMCISDTRNKKKG